MPVEVDYCYEYECLPTSLRESRAKFLQMPLHLFHNSALLQIQMLLMKGRGMSKELYLSIVIVPIRLTIGLVSIPRVPILCPVSMPFSLQKDICFSVNALMLTALRGKCVRKMKKANKGVCFCRSSIGVRGVEKALTAPICRRKLGVNNTRDLLAVLKTACYLC